MSNPIEAAFDEWAEENKHSMDIMGDFDKFVIKEAFAAGVSHAAKANTELIKEYQETMEKKG